MNFSFFLLFVNGGKIVLILKTASDLLSLLNCWVALEYFVASGLGDFIRIIHIYKKKNLSPINFSSHTHLKGVAVFILFYFISLYFIIILYGVFFYFFLFLFSVLGVIIIIIILVLLLFTPSTTLLYHVFQPLPPPNKYRYLIIFCASFCFSLLNDRTHDD